MRREERTYATRTITITVTVRENIKQRVLESLRAALEACAKGMFFVKEAKASITQEGPA